MSLRRRRGIDGFAMDDGYARSSVRRLYSARRLPWSLAHCRRRRHWATVRNCRGWYGFKGWATKLIAGPVVNEKRLQWTGQGALSLLWRPDKHCSLRMPALVSRSDSLATFVLACLSDVKRHRLPGIICPSNFMVFVTDFGPLFWLCPVSRLVNRVLAGGVVRPTVKVHNFDSCSGVANGCLLISCRRQQ